MSTGFTFGNNLPSNQTQTPAFGGFNFGNTAKPTDNTALNFSAMGSTPAVPSLFGNITSAATTTTPSLFPSFTPSSLASTTASSLFPTTLQPATTTSGFSFGGFGPSTTSAASTFGLGLSTIAATTTATTAANVGLGGVDMSQTSGGLNGTSAAGKKDNKAIKENLLPNEISVTIESFKKYVKEQKSIREEMSRVSCKNILRVQEQTIALRQLLSVVSNGLQRNALSIEKLKQESALELRNAEIAQRTKDTPPTLQYENTSPSEYFHNLSVNFEHQMQSYRQQIEQLERHLISLSQSSVLTSNELTVIMHRLHDTFVALAAQLQTVHQAVQAQKELFLNQQRVVHGDVSSVFKSRREGAKEPSPSSRSAVTVGPSPFSSMPSAAAVAMASALNRTQQPAVGSSPAIGTGVAPGILNTVLGSGGLMGNLSTNLGSSFSFQSSSTFKPLGQMNFPSFSSSNLSGGSGGFGDGASQMSYAFNQKPFQLQKPPLGNKRGKRWTST